MIFKALLVYGLLILFAGSTVALTCFLLNSAERIKKLEMRLVLLEEKLDAYGEKAGDDSRRSRRLLTESVSGLNESVTRAVLSLADKRLAEEAEKPSEEEGKTVSEGEVELSGELSESTGGVFVPTGEKVEHLEGEAVASEDAE